MLDGHLIPKNSQVIPLLYSIHMDDGLWDKPEQFNPSRFLNSAGAVEKPEYFMPFGVGRRMCLGEVLARQEIFLFFSSLLHVYHLEGAEGCKLPDLTGKIAVTCTPDDYDVSFKRLINTHSTSFQVKIAYVLLMIVSY